MSGRIPTAAELPPTPRDLFDERGELKTGTFLGAPSAIDMNIIAAREGALFDLKRRKRWMYFAIATDELYIGAAIVDAGYAANAFAFAASVAREASGMLADVSYLGLARLGCHVGDLPEEGCDAWFRAPGASFSFERPGDQGAYEIQIVTSKLTVHARVDLAGAPPPVCAVARPDGSPGMFTEKRALLSTRGEVLVGGRRRSLDGALAGFDYTQGFPPRETAWKWAYLLGKTTDGRRIALNLVEGWNGQPECAIWLEGEAHPVGEGRFEFDHAQPMLPWRITTTCGSVDLTFTPAAKHAERRNLLVVQSFFVQPAGTFRGRIRVPGHGDLQVEAAPGVVEDQFVRW
jgi:hypothetical protein